MCLLSICFYLLCQVPKPVVSETQSVHGSESVQQHVDDNNKDVNGPPNMQRKEIKKRKQKSPYYLVFLMLKSCFNKNNNTKLKFQPTSLPRILRESPINSRILMDLTMTT